MDLTYAIYIISIKTKIFLLWQIIVGILIHQNYEGDDANYIRVYR